ncbi:PAS domain S-box protein [Desulfobacter postgatei]|uniref:PAS domain S-box protein n=1 Tax=Desulfobacter postgatei TaxID=2293 RepID=UPI00259BD730|nr:PAS domain S-box protein [uncultured Desulfobacter sp.]
MMTDRETYLNTVLKAIRNVDRLIIKENNPSRLIQKACEELTSTMGYFNAWIALLDQDSRNVTLTGSSGFNGGFKTMLDILDQGIFPSCMRCSLETKELVMIDDPATQCTDCPLSMHYKGRSALTHRLGNFGILSVSVPAHFAHDAEEQDLFVELANDLAFALSKIETEKQIHIKNQIIQTIPHPMSLVSSTYRYLAVNQAYSQFYGQAPDKITGRQITDFIDPEIFEQNIKPHFDRCLKGETLQYETVVDFSEIGERWMRMEYIPFRDKNNQIVGVVSHGLDITERRHAKEVLQKSEERFSLAMEASKDGIWDWDLTTGEIYCSPGVTSMLGYDSTVVLKNLDAWQDLIHPEDRQKALQANLDCVNNLTDSFEVEYRIRTNNGGFKWVLGRGKATHRDASGNALRLVGTHQDITERKHFEQQLRHAHKMEAIGTLAGGIAHEFNNMLGIIIGNTELALGDIPEWNPVVDFIQEIKTASLRAKNVVRKLLSVARKTPESRKPIPIGSVIKESLDLMRRIVPATIDIRKNINCSTGMILGDSTEINQVVINLCTNSVHAMAGESGVIEVEADIKQMNREALLLYEDLVPGDYVRLTVKDTGQGIEPASMDRLFDPYFTTKDVDQGLGMGLALVHGIVKKHDGVIKIESEVGKGTIVEVLFPLIEVQAESGTEENEIFKMGTERILLVDDEPSLVKMITQMLKRSGYEVIGKTSSASALKTFKETPEQFDLVISDIAMPEMSGDQLAQAIKQVRPETPVILCTGHSNRMDENKVKIMGIEAFITKPFQKQDIANTVRNVLDEARFC